MKLPWRGLVVACEEYDKPELRLHRCVRDARLVFECVQGCTDAVEDGDHITCLENPSVTEFRDAVAKLTAPPTASKNIFSYFAGHSYESHGGSYMLRLTTSDDETDICLQDMHQHLGDGSLFFGVLHACRGSVMQGSRPAPRPTPSMPRRRLKYDYMILHSCLSRESTLDWSTFADMLCELIPTPGLQLERLASQLKHRESCHRVESTVSLRYPAYFVPPPSAQHECFVHIVLAIVFILPLWIQAQAPNIDKWLSQMVDEPCASTKGFLTPVSFFVRVSLLGWFLTLLCKLIRHCYHLCTHIQSLRSTALRGIVLCIFCAVFLLLNILLCLLCLLLGVGDGMCAACARGFFMMLNASVWMLSMFIALWYRTYLQSDDLWRFAFLMFVFVSFIHGWIFFTEDAGAYTLGVVYALLDVVAMVSCQCVQRPRGGSARAIVSWLLVVHCCRAMFLTFPVLGCDADVYDQNVVFLWLVSDSMVLSLVFALISPHLASDLDSHQEPLMIGAAIMEEAEGIVDELPDELFEQGDVDGGYPCLKPFTSKCPVASYVLSIGLSIGVSTLPMLLLVGLHLFSSSDRKETCVDPGFPKQFASLENIYVWLLTFGYGLHLKWAVGMLLDVFLQRGAHDVSSVELIVAALAYSVTVVSGFVWHIRFHPSAAPDVFRTLALAVVASVALQTMSTSLTLWWCRTSGLLHISSNRALLLIVTSAYFVVCAWLLRSSSLGRVLPLLDDCLCVSAFFMAVLSAVCATFTCARQCRISNSRHGDLRMRLKWLVVVDFIWLAWKQFAVGIPSPSCAPNLFDAINSDICLFCRLLHLWLVRLVLSSAL